ncbi:MAG: CPBP family intramembrane metalloprotease [Anaerolineae bacterium]|nr:CPBP family intramembrane metalloprotease [Anaerolineae bacterium]
MLDKVRAVTGWLWTRIEVLVPLLALPVFFSMVRGDGGELPTGFTVLVWGAAAVYIGLVIWSPMALPAKNPQPVSWKQIGKAAQIVVPSMLAATLILVGLSYLRTQPGSGSPGFISALLLATLLGSVGVAAEGTLPVDLFPEFRWRKVKRILYAVVAAFFLILLSFLWENLFSSIVAEPIGAVMGEIELEAGDAASSFDTASPLLLLVNMLIGAGFFEEMLFRVGIMTIVWRLTRRWGWGLLVSALLFGFYHISPLSGQGAYNLQTAPVMAVLSSVGMGLANGFIYRHRGFLTAVLAHGLGNWLVLMIMSGAGSM